MPLPGLAACRGLSAEAPLENALALVATDARTLVRHAQGQGVPASRPQSTETVPPGGV